MNYVIALQAQLQAMAKGFVQALPSLAIALLVLFLTWFIARFAVRIADRLTARTPMRESLKQLVETLVRLCIWLVGIMVAATIAMPGLTPASLIAGLGVGALAIGFAFQDIFQNFLAGVLIMIRDKMRIGDTIECEGILGKVERITLRETHIRQLSNELTVMPNAMLFKNPVKILTDADLRRDQITVGVSYDCDLEFAVSTIRNSVSVLELVVKDKAVDVFPREFGASSIDLLVRWWVPIRSTDLFSVRGSVIIAIKRALDDAGIEIPFPYVTNTFKDPLPGTDAAFQTAH